MKRRNMHGNCTIRERHVFNAPYLAAREVLDRLDDRTPKLMGPAAVLTLLHYFLPANIWNRLRNSIAEPYSRSNSDMIFANPSVAAQSRTESTTVSPRQYWRPASMSSRRPRTP